MNILAPKAEKKKKKKKKKDIKEYLILGQKPNFKIISQKCSSYDPLPKLLK